MALHYLYNFNWETCITLALTFSAHSQAALSNSISYFLPSMRCTHRHLHPHPEASRDALSGPKWTLGHLHVWRKELLLGNKKNLRLGLMLLLQ